MKRKIDFTAQNMDLPIEAKSEKMNDRPSKKGRPRNDVSLLTPDMFEAVYSKQGEASHTPVVMQNSSETEASTDVGIKDEKNEPKEVKENEHGSTLLSRVSQKQKKVVPVRRETLTPPASEMVGAQLEVSHRPTETAPVILKAEKPEVDKKEQEMKGLVGDLLKSPKEIAQEVIDNLPRRVRRLLKTLEKKAHKELALVTYLATVSGICPNYMGNYNNDWLEANLYFIIIAPFAEGKGFTKKFQEALEKIDDRLEEQNQAAEKEYKRLLKEYKASGGDGDEPEKPKRLMLTMPIDNSKAGLIYLLNENKGRGFLFETEIEALVDAIKQDYGNYSHLLRQAYHHESLKNFRKALLSYIRLKKLYLSIILTGTIGQLFSLIPNIENGLFSRFTFFEMEPDPTFHKVFSKNRVEIEQQFEETAEYFNELHYSLQQRQDDPIIFELQPHQEEHFVEFNQILKAEFAQNVDTSSAGIINRWAVMCFRLLMILSILRLDRTDNLPDTIVCTDDDYYNGIELFKILKAHSMSVYYKMPPVELPKGKEEEYAPTIKQELLPKARELWAQGKGMSYREISLALFNTKTKHQTVYRWLNS